MTTFPIAVQTYTVRRELAQDYEGSFARIASIGFKGIEAGPPPDGMTVSDQKALFDRLGLKVVSTHAPFDSLDFDPNDIADYLDTVDGGRYVAISLRFASKEDILKKAESLNQIGATLQQRGITLLYHNHNWEFERFDDEYVLDILMRETDPSFVQTELDTYWIKRGGVDPATYLAGFKGRAPLLHIKDVEASPDQFFAEIGEGVLDFPSIASVADSVGVKWMIVEQDETRRNPFESLEISYRNLQRLGILQG